MVLVSSKDKVVNSLSLELSAFHCLLSQLRTGGKVTVREYETMGFKSLNTASSLIFSLASSNNSVYKGTIS